ncbi:MAG: peptidase M28 [Rhodanobacteraceae bacterium]
MAAEDTGKQLHAFATELYPICRSITGGGVRESLRLIGRRIPLQLQEVRSGSRIFDWEVPLEWNIEDAYVKDSDGRKVVDFGRHNLHIVSYSEPVAQSMALAQLRRNLHTHRSNPEWIPYRTSYYQRNWGFCMRGRDYDQLREGRYEIRIASSLQPGSLTYGEFVLPGHSREEVLLFTHVCHPSLANDNTTGMAIATWLATWLAQEPRRFSYRIVFAPGTIGSLCWLKHHERRLARIRHGLVLGLLGDRGALTYKRSRRGDADIDRIVEYALGSLDPQARTIPFEPYGYDERQLCSPGFNLPVGRLTRSVNDGYPEYHSSADDLDLISPQQLAASFAACRRICEVIEADRRYINLSPKGEPRLGKRGLYGSIGGNSPVVREHAMLWLLNQSDGTKSVLDVAQRSGHSFDTIAQAATDLEKAALLREIPDSGRNVKPRRKR